MSSILTAEQVASMLHEKLPYKYARAPRVSTIHVMAATGAIERAEGGFTKISVLEYIEKVARGRQAHEWDRNFTRHLITVKNCAERLIKIEAQYMGELDKLGSTSTNMPPLLKLQLEHKRTQIEIKIAKKQKPLIKRYFTIYRDIMKHRKIILEKAKDRPGILAQVQYLDEVNKSLLERLKKIPTAQKLRKPKLG